jgi:hypothetical protein
MKIQDVITALSIIIDDLSEIKMEKVRDEITDKEAKKKCAAVLKKTLEDNIMEKAFKEWK